jgi:hypothetical protein
MAINLGLAKGIMLNKLEVPMVVEDLIKDEVACGTNSVSTSSQPYTQTQMSLLNIFDGSC